MKGDNITKGKIKRTKVTQIVDDDTRKVIELKCILKNQTARGVGGKVYFLILHACSVACTVGTRSHFLIYSSSFVGFQRVTFDSRYLMGLRHRSSMILVGPTSNSSTLIYDNNGKHIKLSISPRN